jgi:hypothetical protein
MIQSHFIGFKYISKEILRLLNVNGTPDYAYKIALTRLVWYIKWRLKDVGFLFPKVIRM